jgi:hypothetical protein
MLTREQAEIERLAARQEDWYSRQRQLDRRTDVSRFYCEACRLPFLAAVARPWCRRPTCESLRRKAAQPVRPVKLCANCGGAVPSHRVTCSGPCLSAHRKGLAAARRAS